MDGFDAIGDGRWRDVGGPPLVPHLFEQVLVRLGQHGFDFGRRESVAVEEEMRKRRTIGQSLQGRVHVTGVAQVLKTCGSKSVFGTWIRYAILLFSHPSLFAGTTNKEQRVWITA